MKNASKIVVFSILLLISQKITAQEINFIAGYNASSMAIEGDDSIDLPGIKSKPGFHVGASINLRINDYLTFQPGLNFTTKGVLGESSLFGITQKSSIQFYYLDIPLNIVANFDITEELGAFVSTGPYAGIGLIGETNVEASGLGVSENVTEPVEWGTDVERLDFGLSLGVGLTYKPFLLGINYDYGLANILVDAPEGNSIRNKVFRISLGYTLSF